MVKVSEDFKFLNYLLYPIAMSNINKPLCSNKFCKTFKLYKIFLEQYKLLRFAN